MCRSLIHTQHINTEKVEHKKSGTQKIWILICSTIDWYSTTITIARVVDYQWLVPPHFQSIPHRFVHILDIYINDTMLLNVVIHCLWKLDILRRIMKVFGKQNFILIENYYVMQHLVNIHMMEIQVVFVILYFYLMYIPEI